MNVPATPNLGFELNLSTLQVPLSIETKSSLIIASDVEYWSTPAFVKKSRSSLTPATTIVFGSLKGSCNGRAPV